jgi:hypothetical protein
MVWLSITLMTRTIGMAATTPAGMKKHTIYMNRFILHFVVRGIRKRPRGGSRSRVGAEEYHGPAFMRK